MNKGEATRERIIEAAAPLFNQKGFAGCSMADVMEATGLEKGGLYRHFPTKESLAVETFRFASARSTRIRIAGLETVEGALPKLRYTVAHFVEKPSPVPGGCPLMNTAVDADDGNPVLRELVREAFAGWRSRLCAIVEEGLRSGEIREGTEPRAVANTVIASLEGAMLLSRLSGGNQPLKDAQWGLEILFRGIAAKRK